MSAYSIATRGLAGRKIPQGVLTPMNTLLFGSGEPGAWYDPADLSTLFQDTAGTTPVTAVEQAVALMLDKSGRGNHASQATSTKRPKYSRRVNLLTKTEQFDNAAWVTSPTGTLTTSNSGIAPDGTLTAGKVECTQAIAIYIANVVAPVLITGATYRVTVHVRNGAGVPSILFYNGKFGAYKSATINLITGAVTGSNYTTPPVVSVSSNGWVSISVDIVAPDTYGNYCYVQSSSTSAVGDHFFIWHPSLTLTTDAHLPYQRVNTATDYDADPNKFPGYLRFDGVDDALQTGNIDFTGTDKMTVWAGVAVSSCSDQSGIYEFGVNSTTSNGLSMQCMGSTFTTLRGQAFGTSRGVVDAPGFALNTPYQVCAQYDLSAALVKDEIRLRKNGAYVGSPTLESSGTGNFSSYPLTIMARGYMGTFTGGRLYSLIARGAQSSLSQIEAVENLIRKTMRLP